MSQPVLHVAAVVLAHLVIDNTVTYGDARSALALGGLRVGVLGDDDGMDVLGAALDTAETTMHLTMMDLWQETTDRVRATIRLCIARGVDRWFLIEAAYTTNAGCGRALPRRCVDMLIKREGSRVR